MDELTAFVRARLDEDEAAARAGARRTGMPWRAEPQPGTPGGLVLDEIGLVGSTGGLYAAEHIARHDPARVLREVAAKRALLSLHAVHSEPERWGDHPDPALRRQPTGHTAYWCSVCDYDRDYGHIGGREEGCQTLRLLAAVWSDHPGYRAEWAV